MWRWQLKTCWSLLTDLIDVPTQNLLRLALLLMLMMKIVLATVCCILGSWGLVIKPNFCSDFQHKVSSRFWSWSSGRILKLEFGQYFAADVLQRLWRWILVKMLKQGLVNIFNFKFSRDADVCWDFEMCNCIRYLNYLEKNKNREMRRQRQIRNRNRDKNKARNRRDKKQSQRQNKMLTCVPDLEPAALILMLHRPWESLRPAT